MSDSETDGVETESDSGQLWRTFGIVGLLGGAALVCWLQYSSLGGPTGRRMIEIEMMLGQGHNDQAIEATSRMIDQTPTSAWAHRMRGEAFRRIGQLDRAFADLDEAIRLRPDSADALYDRCLAFHDRGDINHAIADCDRAASLTQEGKGAEAVAAMLLARGDFDRAYERLGRLVDRDAESLAPRFYRGQIALFAYGRAAEAADDFAKASAPALGSIDLGFTPSALVPQGPDLHNTIPLAYDFKSDGFYLLVWTHIARVRAGQEDAQDLADQVEKLRRSVWQKAFTDKPFANINGEAERAALAPWPGPVFALFLGKTTPDALRAAVASEADPDGRRKRICDADFYLAEYRLEKAATKEARKLLQAAVADCPASARENWFAKFELGRLKS